MSWEIDNKQLYRILNYPEWSIEYPTSLYNHCIEEKYFQIPDFTTDKLSITKKGKDKLKELERGMNIDNILNDEE